MLCPGARGGRFMCCTVLYCTVLSEIDAEGGRVDGLCKVVMCLCG